MPDVQVKEHWALNAIERCAKSIDVAERQTSVAALRLSL